MSSRPAARKRDSLGAARKAGLERTQSQAKPQHSMWFSMEEMVSYPFTRGVAGELIGTFLLVFTVVLARVSNQTAANHFDSEDNVSARTVVLESAWTYGMAVTVLTFMFGPVSGGHLNPAVTLALFVARKISAMKAVAYATMQVMGGMLGALVVHVVCDAGGEAFKRSFKEHVFLNAVREKYSLAALLTEGIMTFMVIFCVMLIVDGRRARAIPFVSSLAPLGVGLAYLVGNLVLIPIDNCSMNPALSFGSAVAAGNLEGKTSHWVFWAGPLAGALVASLLYTFFFAAQEPTQAPANTRQNSLRVALHAQAADQQPSSSPQAGAATAAAAAADWGGATAPHDD